MGMAIEITLNPLRNRVGRCSFPQTFPSLNLMLARMPVYRVADRMLSAAINNSLWALELHTLVRSNGLAMIKQEFGEDVSQRKTEIVPWTYFFLRRLQNHSGFSSLKITSGESSLEPIKNNLKLTISRILTVLAEESPQTIARIQQNNSGFLGEGVKINLTANIPGLDEFSTYFLAAFGWIRPQGDNALRVFGGGMVNLSGKYNFLRQALNASLDTQSQSLSWRKMERAKEMVVMMANRTGSLWLGDFMKLADSEK